MSHSSEEVERPDEGDEAEEAELTALVGLAGVPGVGPRTLRQCQHLGAAAQWALARAGKAHLSPALAPLARAAGGTDLASGARTVAGAVARLDPSAEVARHRSLGHSLLVWGRRHYPNRLIDDPDPPALLFAAGHLDALEGPAVALVGTRNATRAGRELAAELALGLVRCGVAVVSGLALGIDGAAHQAVLDRSEPDGPWGSGRPIGVIASGLDIAYPRRHAALHRAVAAQGLLLSETPLGGRPLPWRFPARNRIIAGLVDVVVVVESRSAGGSMLTAGEALLRGTSVMAVPGHPTAPAAAGTNDLLFDGAGPVRHVGDVLGALGLLDRRPLAPPSNGDRPELALDAELRSLLALLGAEPRSLEELAQATGRPLDALADGLTRLEAGGHVVRSGGWYEQVHHRSRRRT